MVIHIIKAPINKCQDNLYAPYPVRSIPIVQINNQHVMFDDAHGDMHIIPISEIKLNLNFNKRSVEAFAKESSDFTAYVCWGKKEVKVSKACFAQLIKTLGFDIPESYAKFLKK